jgi:hypothetical protein
MKATLVVGAFLAAGLIASPVFAKVGEPISGTQVGLEHDPGSVVIAQTKTNSAGVAIFQSVKPGKYRLIIGTILWPRVDSRGKISENESPRPAASIEINIPGQAKVVGTISKANALSKTREDLNFSIRFIVAGNRAQTVTAFVEQTLGYGF